MSSATIVVSFTVCIFFNIFLNSFDVYSDTTLAYKTLTFQLGDSILLSGCGVCYGKNDEEIYKYKDRSCQQCVTRSVSGFHCGGSFELLNKVQELDEKDVCENEVLGLQFKVNPRSFNVTNEACDHDKHVCCIENGLESTTQRALDFLDKRILAHHTGYIGYNRDNLNYDTYILSSRLGNLHCQRIFHNYFDRSHQKNFDFIESNAENTKNKNELALQFKFTKQQDGKILLEKGFNHEDNCGFLINKKDILIDNNVVNTCGNDLCLLHLQSLKFLLNISDFDHWKKETFYNGGRKFGGNTCQLLMQYGLAILVPIVLNTIFNIIIFCEDIRLKKASYYEMIFVMILFYPQWKTIRFLTGYLIQRNEDKFIEEKDKFDVEIGALEPFLESAFQVSHLFNF